MDTTQMAHQVAATALEPRGGRIGVAFDWGFATQIAITSLASLAGMPVAGMALPTVAALGGLGFAGLVVAQGEALRRGSGLARRIQIGANSVLTVAGLASIPLALAAVQQGNFWPLYTSLLLLVVSPMEVWLLLQPGSKATYGKLGAQAFLARHSGQWLVGTVAWAIAGGVLQTLAAAAR